MKREPALILGAVSAIVSLVIGFGAAITPVQFGLIMAAVSAVLALVTRSLVTPASVVAATVTSSGRTVAGPASDVVDGRGVEVVAAYRQ